MTVDRAAVWGCGRSGGELLVLLALAESMGEGGSDLSAPRLARMVGLSERQARRVLAALVADGALLPCGYGVGGLVRYRFGVLRRGGLASATPDTDVIPPDAGVTPPDMGDRPLTSMSPPLTSTTGGIHVTPPDMGVTPPDIHVTPDEVPSRAVDTTRVDAGACLKTKNQTPKNQQTNNNPPLPPLPAQAANPGSAPTVAAGLDGRDVEDIRTAVWRASGLTDDQIATRRCQTSLEGVRQIRQWFALGWSAGQILELVEEVFAPQARRGQPVKLPWQYLTSVIERRTAEANPPPVVAEDEPLPIPPGYDQMTPSLKAAADTALAIIAARRAKQAEIAAATRAVMASRVA